MPAKSKAQYNFMQAVLHNSKGLRGGDSKSLPSKAVAKHFIDETPSKKRKEFAKQ